MHRHSNTFFSTANDRAILFFFSPSIVRHRLPVIPGNLMATVEQFKSHSEKGQLRQLS